ncbi:MAG: hypothetical protein IT373_23095 [Polyangiaceae bacterium]|nr:hypothetical protein [Polyangiaceae bacterium]
MTQPDDKENERKERVIHTRVPAVLERELKRLAQSLRVPVSNVVRTILEDAVNAVDAVGRHAEGELRTVADRLHKSRLGLIARATGSVPEGATEDDAAGDATAAAPVETGVGAATPPPPAAPGTDDDGIVGFQPLLLARAGRCTRCGCELAAGTEAFLGMRDTPGPRVVLGPECRPFRDG